MADVELNFDEGAIKQMLSEDLLGGTQRAAERTRDRVQTLIVLQGRVDTGAMVNSVRYTPHTITSTYVSFEVRSDLHYTIYQEHGTNGAHARPGGVLVFKPKGAQAYVFAKSVRGFPGAHMFRDALNALTIRDFLE